MKKTLALVLALVLLLTLCACSKEEEKTPTVPVDTTAPTETEPQAPETTEPVTEPENLDVTGVWAWDMQFNPAYWESVGVEGVTKVVTIRTYLDLRADGTGQAIRPQSSLVDTCKDLMEIMEDYLPSLLYASYAEQGLDEAAADAAMKEAYGMTVKEFAAATLADFSDEDLLLQFNLSPDTEDITYSTEGNVLILDGDRLTVSPEGDKLVITDTDNEQMKIMMLFPSVMVRAELPVEEEPPVVEVDNELIGTWQWNVVLGSDFWASNGMEGATVSVTLPLHMEFRKDGMAEITLNAADEGLREDLLNLLTEYTIALTYAQLADQGLDEAAADAQMKTETGKTVPEYVAEIYAAMDMDDLVASMGLEQLNETAAYTLEGDQLTVEDAVYTIELIGDTLTLTPQGEVETNSLLGEPPYIMTRIQ